MTLECLTNNKAERGDYQERPKQERRLRERFRKYQKGFRSKQKLTEGQMTPDIKTRAGKYEKESSKRRRVREN